MKLSSLLCFWEWSSEWGKPAGVPLLWFLWPPCYLGAIYFLNLYLFFSEGNLDFFRTFGHQISRTLFCPLSISRNPALLEALPTPSCGHCGLPVLEFGKARWKEMGVWEVVKEAYLSLSFPRQRKVGKPIQGQATGLCACVCGCVCACGMKAKNAFLHRAKEEPALWTETVYCSLNSSLISNIAWFFTGSILKLPNNALYFTKLLV